MKKQLLTLGIIASVGGVGALCWWKLQVRPIDALHPSARARPLSLRLQIEKASAERPVMGDPLAAGLHVLPAPEMPANDAITDSQCVWRLQSVKYRPRATDEWRDVTPARGSRTTVVDLYSQHQKVGYGDVFFPQYDKPGEWKSVVRADVAVRAGAEEWHGTVTHEFKEMVTAPQLKRRAALRKTVEQRFNQAAPDKDVVPQGAGSA